MPSLAAKPCRSPGCGQLVRNGSSYCPAHKRTAPGSFADKDRGTRHQRGYGTDWDKLRPQIIERDGYRCRQCGTPVGDMPYSAYVDHIKSKGEGGTDDPDNLQTLCRRCHTAKTDKEKNQHNRPRHP